MIRVVAADPFYAVVPKTAPIAVAGVTQITNWETWGDQYLEGAIVVFGVTGGPFTVEVQKSNDAGTSVDVGIAAESINAGQQCTFEFQSKATSYRLVVTGTGTVSYMVMARRRLHAGGSI